MSYKASIVGKAWSIVKTQPTDVDMGLVKEKFLDRTNINTKSITDELEVDIDLEGKRLNMYVVQEEVREIYAVICDGDYNINYAKLDIDESYQKQISDLKLRSNWACN